MGEVERQLRKAFAPPAGSRRRAEVPRSPLCPHGNGGRGMPRGSRLIWGAESWGALAVPAGTRPPPQAGGSDRAGPSTTGGRSLGLPGQGEQSRVPLPGVQPGPRNAAAAGWQLRGAEPRASSVHLWLARPDTWHGDGAGPAVSRPVGTACP